MKKWSRLSPGKGEREKGRIWMVWKEQQGKGSGEGTWDLLVLYQITVRKANSRWWAPESYRQGTNPHCALYLPCDHV